MTQSLRTGTVCYFYLLLVFNVLTYKITRNCMVEARGWKGGGSTAVRWLLPDPPTKRKPASLQAHWMSSDNIRLHVAYWRQSRVYPPCMQMFGCLVNDQTALVLR